MKILLVGDYSNYHPTLGAALARRGHEVTIASDGSRWMNTARSIDLRRRLPGPAGGALLYARLAALDPLRGYDVVSLISPCFVTLRPGRLRYLFDRLRRRNGAVYLASVGTDKAFMDMLTAADCPLRYSEYTLPDGTPNPASASAYEADRRWQQGAVADYCDYVYEHVDGCTTALYEYDLAMRRCMPGERVVYCGIPVDTSIFTPGGEFAPQGRVRLFLGRDRHRMAIKGTDLLGKVAQQVVADMPGECSLDIVENVPFAEYVERQQAADVVLDQVYSYTPATNALMAMARAKAVVSGAEPAYYDFIGEHANRPIFNAVPDEQALYDTIRAIVTNREATAAAATASPDFVARHNAADVVAERCLSLWVK